MIKTELEGHNFPWQAARINNFIHRLQPKQMSKERVPGLNSPMDNSAVASEQPSNLQPRKADLDRERERSLP
jgi:hypothetical protein